MDLLFNIQEIAAFLGVNVKTARNRLSKYNIQKTKTVDGRSMFCSDKVAELKLTYVDRRKKKEKFIILESRMNYPD